MFRKDLEFIIDSLLEKNPHSAASYESIILRSYISCALEGIALPQKRYYDFALAQTAEDVEADHRDEYKFCKAFDINFSIISFGLSLMAAIVSGEIKIDNSWHALSVIIYFPRAGISENFILYIYKTDINFNKKSWHNSNLQEVNHDHIIYIDAGRLSRGIRDSNGYSCDRRYCRIIFKTHSWRVYYIASASRQSPF